MMKRPPITSLHIVLLALLLASCGLVFALRSSQVTPVSLTPSLTGEEEYCLSCHADLPEISASHPVEAFGCVVCHGGERLALDADLAHSTMIGGDNPSSLAVVEQSCGGSECHSGAVEDHRDHIQRVMTSVQATYAGAIATVRYAFGEQDSLTAEQGIFAIADDRVMDEDGVPALTAFDPAESPLLEQFGENCLSCHLSSQPMEGSHYARLDGCAACHTPTAGEDLAATEQHTLTTAIPYTQCNTCHNRGNYSLKDMSFHAREDSELGRLSSYYQPIAQFVRCEYTLDCVDCHTRSEAMGDGDIYSNQTEIQYVQCKTCHGTIDSLPLTYTITDPEDLALRVAALNPIMDLQVGDTIIVTEQGEPMWNARQLPDGSFEMVGKATGAYFTFNTVLGTDCQQNVDEQESQYCHACHAVDH